jgi:hypothetical protein
MLSHTTPPRFPAWIIHTLVLGSLFVAAVLIAFRVV